MILMYHFTVFHDDTDFSGVMYHANHVKYFERARTSLLHEKGLTHFDLKNNFGLFIVVHKISVRYIKPCFLEDELDIKTEIIKKSKVSIEIKQIMYRKSMIIAEANLEIVCINASSKLSIWPEEILKKL